MEAEADTPVIFVASGHIEPPAKTLLKFDALLSTIMKTREFSPFSSHRRHIVVT